MLADLTGTLMQQTEGELMAKRGTRVPVLAVDQPVAGAVPPENLQAIFGRNFRERRLAVGITQAAAARAAEMHRQALAEIEAGRGNVTLKTMQRLATVIGCRVEVLLILITDA